MEPTLLLCALIALTSGLHFGRRFAQAHQAGGAYLLPALAHGVVCSALVLLSTLLDPTPGGLLWMAVAAVGLCGLAIGALRPLPARAQGGQTLTLERESRADVQAA
ncbi:hypothetical protein [Deinococcus multiflagellatus]|uniref:Uncharacterized protein n=1 Tax=Deinococcus multiflagellatus TaxID=1656887 RepID=A0ABW1ZLD2_9DEIO|nr:hypothetical protein [Deinococcus multiflagellatus]MBZ9714177.1 hypothetical protein [Deinococcus multiflagellatus]